MITLAKLIRQRPCFTIIEVLIASTIFSMVTLIGVTVFVNVVRVQHRISLENAIYEDGRFMMERLAREIRKNTVDYEEYYNQLVSGGDYGSSYGCYASRFYNPGSDKALGALCANGKDPKNDPGCIIDKTSLDTNTLQNPFDGLQNTAAQNESNAMCDKYFPGVKGVDCKMQDGTLNDQKELYLIDYKGTQKTFFALKKVGIALDGVTPENALSIVKLKGLDTDNDGIDDDWKTPADGFDFTFKNGLKDTLNATGANVENLYKGFVPISPLRTNIVDLHFYVSPLEDPRKAFNETDPADSIQQQPHVTVVMTLQPAASELINFAGNTPTVTIQQTISSRVYNEVRSFRGGVCGNYL